MGVRSMQLAGEVFLATVAQVGITLGGFITVIVAFRGSSERLAPNDMAATRWVLELTLPAVLFALLPFPFFYWSGSETDTWRIMSGLAAVWLEIVFLIQLVRLNYFKRRALRPRSPLLYPVLAITAVLGLIEGANGILWGTSHLYFFGLIWMLFAAGSQFFVFANSPSVLPVSSMEGRIGEH
jgi:hypothetical protein